jgi:spore maturation protein CgeB
MERRDYDANPNIFRDGESCIVFDNIDNLYELLSWLEEDGNDILESVSYAGQNSVLSHHTYENRCQKILKTVFPHEC